MISEDLLKILVCPETKQPLAVAPQETVDALNTRIREGALRDRAGEKVERPIEAGLIRRDGRVLYAIVDDIPRMLIERGIPTDQDTAGAS